MSFVWTALTFLFFFSLFMVLVSVFTPKTALFFKEKTKSRGAILWLSSALVCAVLVNEFGPTFAPGSQVNATQALAPVKTAPEPLPGYRYQIRENTPGKRLSIDCTLNSEVSREGLRALALKVYAANKGNEYKEVLITWRLPDQPKDSPAWAVTNCLDGNWEITASDTRS